MVRIPLTIPFRDGRRKGKAGIADSNDVFADLDAVGIPKRVSVRKFWRTGLLTMATSRALSERGARRQQHQKAPSGELNDGGGAFRNHVIVGHQ